MPAQVARIMMSVLILGLGALLYPTFVMIAERVWPRPMWNALPLWTAGFLSWMFVRLAWYLVWRRQIVHTDGRLLHSLALMIITPAFALLLWLILDRLLIFGPAYAHILASAVAPIVSLMATVLSYAQTSADRATQALVTRVGTIHCPNCDYNLAGLTSTRCPECGKEYALDALLTAQALPAGEDV